MATWMVLSVLITLFILGISTLSIWFYWKHRKIIAEARKFPTGRLALPLLGHAYLIVKGFVGISNALFNMIQASVAQSITTIVLWAGPYPAFLISDPLDIQVILNSTKSLDKGLEIYLLKYAIGNCLAIAPGYIWKPRRRHMNPMFHPRNMEYLLPQINECGRELTVCLSQLVNQGEFDILKYIYTCSFKSANFLVFGPDVKVDVESETTQNVMQAVDRISQLAAVRLFKFWLWPEFIFKYVYKKEVNEIFSSGKAFVGHLIKWHEQKRKIHEKQIINNGDNSKNNELEDLLETETGNNNNLTMMDTYNILQQACPGFNEEDLYCEIIAILIAGSESSKVTMSSCLLALAANSDIQERLYAEIISVVGSEDSEVTIEHIRAIPYLDQVLKETLRKFIIVPLLTRISQGPLKLSSFTLPAGAMACVAPFGVHHNPKYYPDPHRFDPDRFSPENTAQRDQYTFLPFGAGPRSCIGQSYSSMVIKTLLVHIITKYKFSTTADITNLSYVAGAVARRADGYKVSVELRK